MAHFPKLLRDLPAFGGPFDAFKLEARNCDVLFASYPEGTVIPPHSHDTENVGVITQGELILDFERVLVSCVMTGESEPLYFDHANGLRATLPFPIAELFTCH